MRNQEPEYDNYVPSELLDDVKSVIPKRSHVTDNEILAVRYLQDTPMIGQHITVRQYIQEFAKSIGLQENSILVPGYPFTRFSPLDEDVTITLAGLKLVDTSRTSWDQIFEFRQDNEAKKKLRNLRLFLHTNYAGKENAFIEDDLHKRLEDYQKACNKWSFETTTSLLSTVMDSKNLQTTVGVSAVASLLGEQILVTGALLTGLSIEIGKIAIQIASKKHCFNMIRDNHELAYIIEAEKRLA